MIRETLIMTNGESLETSYDVEDLMKLVEKGILCKDEIRAILLCKDEKKFELSSTVTDLNFLLDKKQKDDIAAKKFRDEHTAVMKGKVPGCAIVDCDGIVDPNNILIISTLLLENEVGAKIEIDTKIEVIVCDGCKRRIIQGKTIKIKVGMKKFSAFEEINKRQNRMYRESNDG